MSRTMERGIKRTCIDRTMVEQTDPDYVCKYVARMAKEYKALAPRWRRTFLEGIPSPYRKDVEEMINQSNPSLQGTGHLVDRTLQGVVRLGNQKEE